MGGIRTDFGDFAFCAGHMAFLSLIRILNIDILRSSVQSASHIMSSGSLYSKPSITILILQIRELSPSCLPKKIEQGTSCFIAQLFIHQLAGVLLHYKFNPV